MVSANASNFDLRLFYLCKYFSETVIVFPCEAGHVTCLECFRQYCVSRLLERQFVEHPSGGFTLQCPVGCEGSYIDDVHHFKLLSKEQVRTTEAYCLSFTINY